MKFKNRQLIKRILSIFILIIILSTSTFAIRECLDGKISDNQHYIQTDDYICDIDGKNFDFSGLNNVIYNCNGYELNAGNKFINLTNSQNISFVNCGIMSFDSNLSTDINTEIFVVNSSFIMATTNDFSDFLGTFEIIEQRKINVVDYDSNFIDDGKFYCKRSGYTSPIRNSGIYNISLQKYVDKTPIDLSVYTCNGSSYSFGDSHQIVRDFDNDDELNISLQDIKPPYLLTNKTVSITDNLIEIELGFDEKVRGIFQLYNNGNLIKQKDIGTLLKNHTILFDSLNKETSYNLSFNVTDRKSGLYTFQYEFTNGFTTYVDSNITANYPLKYEISGNPQSTDSFNVSRQDDRLKIEYVDSLDVVDKNLNLAFELERNLLRINDTYFVRNIKVYFNNLAYQTMPIILSNNTQCVNCINKDYNSTSKELSFDLMPNILTNYSLADNSYINFTNNILYVGKNLTLYVDYFNFSKIDIITGTNCSFEIEGQNYNMIYNLTNQKFQGTGPVFNTQRNVLIDFTCVNPNYDDREMSVDVDLTPQNISDFTYFMNFDDLGSKVTQKKYFNVTITSDGINNIDPQKDVNYYFIITENVTRPYEDWDTKYNLTNWVSLGKNEFFEVYNNGEDFTNIKFQNNTISNFSQLVFFDKRNGDTGSSIFVTVKACVPGDNCKYWTNDTNNLIYRDITAPELIGNIDILQYYPSNNFLNFTYKLRDLESKVKEVYYKLVLSNQTNQNPDIQVNFNENLNYTFEQKGFNMQEGKNYTILLKAINKNDLESVVFESISFLIDTIAPVNSTLNVSRNENGYVNDNLLNITFDTGNDFNDNYSNKNILESGLSHMFLYVKNATLENDNCKFEGDYVKINKTYYQFNTSEIISVKSNKCYKVKYEVYDKAGNLNVVELDNFVKVDNSSADLKNISPVNMPIYDYTNDNLQNAENIEKTLSELELNPILFSVKYSMFDEQSNMDYYNILVIDSLDNSVVYSELNYENDIFDVKYNSSYILDGHNYYVKVIGVNKAGLARAPIVSNGATVFILNYPDLKLDETKNDKNNLNQILDFKDDGVTSLYFEEIAGFDTVCKYYVLDVGYDPLTGVLCDNNVNKIRCDVPTVLGINNYSISCRSNQTVNPQETYHNESSNYDVSIFVENSTGPKISDFSNYLELNETQELLIKLNYSDINSYNYIYSNYSVNISNLTFEFLGEKSDLDKLEIYFIDNNSFDNLIVEEEEDSKILSYYFNNSINYSKIVELSLEINNLKIKDNNVNSIIDSNYTIINENFSKSYLRGISNESFVKDVLNDNNYNIEFNNSHIFWNVLDNNNRRIRGDSFNVTVVFSDFIKTTNKTFLLNLTAQSYYAPYVNYTIFELYNNSNYLLSDFIVLNISDFFFEDNSKSGLADSLEYSYQLIKNLEEYNYNELTNQLTLFGIDSLESSLILSVKNSRNMTKSLELNFNITALDDSEKPQIIINNPVHNTLYNKSNKLFYFNISSDEVLRDLYINVGDVKYTLDCSRCDSFSGNVVLLNLEEGLNDIEVVARDLSGNLNKSNISINYVFNTSALVNDTIYSNVENSQFYIGASNNLSGVFVGLQNVTLKDGSGKKYIVFKNNYSSNNLSLFNVTVLLDNSSSKKKVLVSNLNITDAKSIFIPASLSSFTSICIKDEEVFSFDDISSSCNDLGEVLIECNNVTNSQGYNCKKVNQSGEYFYEVSGLKNSLVQLMCTEDWSYSTWSSCSNSQQTRTAIDQNSCGTFNLREPLVQSCSSSSSGGSSGGGSSGGSSSSGEMYIPIEKENKDDNNKTEIVDKPVVNQTIDDKKDDVKQVYVGSLYEDILVEYDYEKEYVFDFEGKSYKFKIINEQGKEYINFFEENLKLELLEDNLNVDINQDGVDDFYLSNGFSGLEIKKIEEEIIPELGEEIVSVEDENSSIWVWIVALIMLLIVIGVGVGYWYKKYYHNDIVSDSSDLEVVKADVIHKNIQDQMAQNEMNKDVSNLYSSFDDAVGKLEMLTAGFSKLVNDEEKILRNIKWDVRKMLTKGFSWTDIYFYLKSHDVTDFYMKKIIVFDDLISKLERFVLENDVDKMSSDELKNKLLLQDWFGYLYFYDSDGQDILRDVLFMVAGAEIYGFSKKKFEKLFSDELEIGKEKFTGINLDDTLLQMKFDTKNFKTLFKIEEEMKKTKLEIIEFVNIIKKSNMKIEDKKDIAEILKQLLNDVNKHLE